MVNGRRCTLGTTKRVTVNKRSDPSISRENWLGATNLKSGTGQSDVKGAISFDLSIKTGGYPPELGFGEKNSYAIPLASLRLMNRQPRY